MDMPHETDEYPRTRSILGSIQEQDTGGRRVRPEGSNPSVGRESAKKDFSSRLEGALYTGMAGLFLAKMMEGGLKMFESKNTAVEDMAKGVVQGMLEYFEKERDLEFSRFKQEILDKLDALKTKNVKSK